jgi:hypothetical protein
MTGAIFTLKNFTDEPAGWQNGADINGDSRTWRWRARPTRAWC